MRSPTGVMGVCREEVVLVRAVEKLRQQDFSNVTLYTPYPSERLLSGSRPSPIHRYTLSGAVLGFVGGLCFPIWTSLQWNMIGGGKPVISLPPFLVIAFEMTMLLAGVFTAAGLVIHARLLRRMPEPSSQQMYDPRFSQDRFGIFVACEIKDVARVKELALAAGLEEVTVAGG